MQPLDKSLRNKLERTVKGAREIAECAARAALLQLGVADATAASYLSEPDRELRRKLRIHGRQLGDLRNPKTETQEIDRLAEEVAYEHWHRMLFARFLSENDLLMYPDADRPVAVTLEECEDLASEEKALNGWELASRFAAKMLPQIFRPDSPVFQLTLPFEHQQKLERLVGETSSEVFKAFDSLGWVYQFWQSKKKDEVNASEVKIGARELPAVTQLFTEPYMVAFLLDNSIGSWWSLRRLTKADRKNATSEDELRSKIALAGVPLEYLRFSRDSEGMWHPAAGDFDEWPENLSELRVIDPCCGSGHFLVSALLMLAPMRSLLEGLSATEAVDAVIKENLHGLEIDRRCVELAAFALALTAWRYPTENGQPTGFRKLPSLNVACSGLSVSAAKDEWKLFGSGKANLSLALDWIYDLFKDAPILGSLIDPSTADAARLVEWKDLSTVVETVISDTQTDEQHEAGVVAEGLSTALNLLAGKYHLVITNVPYLQSGKQVETLKKFCDRPQYSLAKQDLATVFLARCLEFCLAGGKASIVLPQNWLFLTNYKLFREKLLRDQKWHIIARLGPGAFETISGEVVKAALVIIGNKRAQTEILLDSTPEENFIAGIDAASRNGPSEKAHELKSGEILLLEQRKQLSNPDARVVLSQADMVGDLVLLASVADGFKGMSTGDLNRFIHQFWEMPSVSKGWVLYQGSLQETTLFGGRSQILYWQDGKGQMVKQPSCYVKGAKAWNRRGVTVTQMGDFCATLYEGQMFDENAAAIIPYNEAHRAAVFAFCSSSEFVALVKQIDGALKVTNKTLVKVRFDLDYWQNAAKEIFPDGLPKPYSDDPAQWIFHGTPNRSREPLQVAVARLVGYRWPIEDDLTIDVSVAARELAQECHRLSSMVDNDGIVCIPAVGGELAAADRLLNLLATDYGADWTTDQLSQLLSAADCAGKTLEVWLRDKFFLQHCKLFGDRPFVWHIWDGLRDGFAALVNYHKLDRKLLEALIYTYLGDWMNRQKRDKANNVDGAGEKLAAAEGLKKRLELILEGEQPYDIFVRWKSIQLQPIGWSPDLNDGVRTNIRPFMSVPDIGKKGAGILREKPNISWSKDRGKDPSSAPWSQLFNFERINDHHLSIADKRAEALAIKAEIKS